MKHLPTCIRFSNYFTILFCFFIPPSALEAQISGTVFTDYNASGTTSNPNEPLMANVNFKAYKSKGTFSTLNDKSSETNRNHPITASGFKSATSAKSNNDEGRRAFVIACSATSTEIRGNVFHDLNYNGVKDATETTGQSGITVTATDSLGTTFTATTNASGDYTLSGLNTIRTYRVVFTNLPTWASPTHIGSDNSTTVQFLKSGNCANLGLANGGEYCETNPTLMIPCYLTGLANSTTATTDPAIVKLPFDNSAAQTYVGTVSQFGTVNGVAWQSDANRLFLASFLKRYSGFAQGPGYIYTVDNPKGASPTISSFNLQGVSPANGGAALNFGSVCRRDAFDGDPNASCDPLGTGIAADYTLVSNPILPSRDLDAFLKIGTMSYGDADYDPDNRLLWVVNLFQKGLISIDVSGSIGSLPGTVNQYLIASLPGIPTCTGGTLRPFGLKFYRGKGYLGVVCDASTSQNVANLDAFILTFDPKNVAAGFQTVLSFDLNYPRETALGTNSAAWKPWRVSGTTGSYTVYPQPLVSDIDFTSKGEMIIGLMDRNAQSGGYDNYEPVSNSTALYFVSAAGDLLKACPNGSGFVMEGYTGCIPTLSDTYTTDGASNTDGPDGGGEFFFQDYAENGHNENNLGNIAVLGEKVVSNAYNPVLVSIFMNGLQWYNTTTGADIGNKTLIDYTIDGSRSGKAGGLGDIELLCTTAPLEIGNRVWLDTNKDGVQNAGETGISNIQIQLFADFNNDGTPDGAALATTTTSATAGNALGSWYFNAANVTDGDPTVAGNQAGPQPNKRYLIRIGSADWTGGAGTGDLVGLLLTTANTGGAGQPDVLDNDAMLVSTIPTISHLVGNVGQNDHTLDMGFIACPTITNPSAAQTLCIGASGSNITVNTSYNTANGIRFVKFTSDQSATNGAETTTELANIYAGTALSTVTPMGASSPYTATYTWNSADFPNATSSPITYYVYAILDPDLGATCRPVQEIQITINPAPSVSITQTAPTCSGTTAQNNGKITLTAKSNTDKYGVSTGATYTGVAYASTTALGAVPPSVDLVSNAPNAGQTYTIRFFNGSNTCYKDTTITVAPVTCIAPSLSYTESCKCFDVVYDLPDTDPLEFTDSIKVTSNAGENWRFVSHSGLEVPDTLVNIVLPQNAPLYEFAAGMYGIRFSHTSGVGYTGKITNGIDTLNINNLCTNPSLTIPNLANTEVCPTDAPFSLTTAVATLNGVQEPGIFTFHIVRAVGDTLKNVTVLDPSLITSGTTVQVIGRYVPTNSAYCPHTFVYNVTVKAFCPCGITINSVTPSTCDPFAGATYSLSVNIHWENAPSGEAINITTTSGATASFTPSTISGTQTVVITGLASNGVQNIGTTAQFATTTSCSTTLANAYNAPTNCSAAPCTGGSGSMGGHVFEDLNDNGVNNGESGVSNMIVKIYDCNDNLVTTTLTNATGEWSATGLTDGIKYRVEFSIPSSLPYLASSVHGTNNGTTTQFATAPTCSVDLGLINPSDYCQDNPLVIVPCYFSGPQNNNQPALVGVYYNQADSNTPTENGLVNDNTIGTTYGVAWQRSKKLVWASAMTRHFFDYGPGGFDAIYGISVSDPNGASSPAPSAGVAYTIDLSNLGVNMGTNPRTTPLTGNPPYNDGNVYQSVGKIGIGDIDISDNGDTLFVVNLNAAAPSLVRLNISNPANVTLISETPIPNPGCTGGAFAPWALKYHNGKVYIGGVCTAETSQSVADLTATVYRYDGGTTFTSFATMPLNYDRAAATFRSNDTYSNADWRAWTNTWNPAVLPLSPADLVSQPMPILQDIEFDDDGSLLLGFGDRFSYMTAYGNRRPGLTTGTTYFSPVAAGDLIRFCNVGGTLVLEGTAGSCVQGNTDRGALETPAIPDNIKEYYNDDYLNANSTQAGHSETMLGGLAKLRGKSELLAVTFDPRWNQGPFNTSGVRFLNTNGTASKGWVIVPESATDANRKGGSLGDIEVLCNAAPIEIGNYVWLDQDKDGVQDPCEPPLSNVTVELWKNGSKIATTTTNTTGEYYFKDKNAPSVTWLGTGADTTLLENSTYEIKINKKQAKLDTTVLTTANSVIHNGDDLNDNDAVMRGDSAIISLTTGSSGFVNHTYDFGFNSCHKPALLDTTLAFCGNQILNLTTLVRDTATSTKDYTAQTYHRYYNDNWTVLTDSTMVSVAATDSFYVIKDPFACNPDTMKVKIVINPVPTTPSVSSPIYNICPLTTVDLTTISSALTPSVSGGSFEWHVSNSSSSALVSNPTGVAAGDYYLFERSPAACYSTGLKVTTAIQVCCPTPECIPVLLTKKASNN